MINEYIIFSPFNIFYVKIHQKEIYFQDFYLKQYFFLRDGYNLI